MSFFLFYLKYSHICQLQHEISDIPIVKYMQVDVFCCLQLLSNRQACVTVSGLCSLGHHQMSSFLTVSSTLSYYIPHDSCLFIALSCPLSLIIAYSCFSSHCLYLSINTLSVLVLVTESLWYVTYTSVSWFEFVLFLVCLFCYWTANMDFDPCMDDDELDCPTNKSVVFGSTCFSPFPWCVDRDSYKTTH